MWQLWQWNIWYCAWYNVCNIEVILRIECKSCNFSDHSVCRQQHWRFRSRPANQGAHQVPFVSTITASCLIAIPNLWAQFVLRYELPARVLPRRQFGESSPRKYNNDKLILHRKSLRDCKSRFARRSIDFGVRIYYLFRFNRFYTYRPVYRNSSLTRGNKSLGDNCQSTKIPPRHTARPVRDANKWMVRLRVFLAIVKRRRWMKTRISLTKGCKNCAGINSILQ